VTQRFDARGERRGEVEQFLREYHAQFDTVSTTFSNAVDSESAFALEWSSEATLANGRPVTYRGVTVIDFEGGDMITTLRTYYDSAQFAVAPAETGCPSIRHSG
jgi:ketosteroid isomerase-like protein